MDKIKVVVVDDSLTVRKAFTALLSRAFDIELLGTAEDPIAAIELLKKGWPDVFVLDIEMPKIDGLTFLKKIMREKPTPVIICSTLTGSANSVAQNAYAYGAAAVMGKPSINANMDFVNASDDILQTIRSLKSIEGKKFVNTAPAAPPKKTALPNNKTTAMQLIAIGSSTGGPQALERIIPMLPANMPPVVIVQHMPTGFTEMLAKRLDSISELTVVEAQHNMKLTSGMVAIAPGGYHTQVVYDTNGALTTDVRDGPLVNRHKPAVDMLYRSVLENINPKRCLAVILTGMGNDGANGMAQLKAKGCQTIAQDEKSSVVWGMPGEAVKLNCVDHTISLEKIAEKILSLTYGE